MDPNAALKQIRSLIELVRQDKITDSELYDLAYLIEGLDNWLSKGGVLPEAWEMIQARMIVNLFSEAAARELKRAT
jgi:hypothetical protein